jgi:4-alpha-glucanotransferase
MALQRLWWIPPGAPATDGVYVRYPTDELVAVVAIESHRHGAVIVGEDLGTVSATVRSRMRRCGMLGMHEEQFAIDAAPDHGLAPVPAPVVAGMNTHDMPTFAGFCQGTDIVDHAALGLYDDAGASAALARRADAIRTYADLLGVHTDPAPLLAAGLRRLGSSPARMVSVGLEDLWLEPEPQNVPGTSAERRNWTRRLALPAEAIPTDPRVVDGLAALRAARRLAPCRAAADPSR